MSNPNNLLIMKGTIVSKIEKVYNKSNELIYVEFDLKVPRNYLNRGVQQYDFPRIKVSRSSEISKLETVKIGDKISMVGSYYSEFYTYQNKQVKKQRVDAESICIESNVEESNQSMEQLELPY